MSRLRVIAGTAKGRRLRLVPGESTRPVTDRVKEALFNILGALVAEASFLDLFAGTGSVGIEALSRGVALATFVESNPVAVRTIEGNLALTELKERARVVKGDVLELLARPGQQPYELVYVAPPQYRGLWLRTLHLLDKSQGWLAPEAWIIAQIDPHEFEPVELENLQLFDQRTYGSTMLVFFEAISGPDPEARS